jgi:hypothetical protein
MSELIQFPERKAAPLDWMLSDLFELREEILLFVDNDEVMELIDQLIEGRQLILEIETIQSGR